SRDLRLPRCLRLLSRELLYPAPIGGMRKDPHAGQEARTAAIVRELHVELPRQFCKISRIGGIAVEPFDPPLRINENESVIWKAGDQSRHVSAVCELLGYSETGDAGIPLHLDDLVDVINFIWTKFHK